MAKHIEILETRDFGRVRFHIYVNGYYHCSCVSRDEAERIAAERFTA